MSTAWIIGLISAAIAFIGLLFTLFKWALAQSETRVNGRFKDHGIKIQNNADAIKENEKLVNATRDELHKDYVSYPHLNNFVAEIKEDVRGIFNKIENMSSKLNQLIGQNRRGPDDES